jgi:hypothetical protein
VSAEKATLRPRGTVQNPWIRLRGIGRVVMASSSQGETRMQRILSLAALLTAALFVVSCTAVQTTAPKTTSTEKAAPAAKTAAPTEKLSEEGFAPIFNGKDLTGWDGDAIHWSVKDGAIRGEATQETMVKGGNTFLIWQGGKPEDFDLRLSVKMVGGNSGIQYRSFTRPEKWVAGGYQMEVSTDAKKCGFIYGELYRGGIANVGEKTYYAKDGKKEIGKFGDAAEIAKTYKLNDWNEYRIVARGHHIEQYINGVQTVDLIDDSTQARLDGIIALQIHQGYVMTVEFKDIRLKTLPKDAAAVKPVGKLEN